MLVPVVHMETCFDLSYLQCFFFSDFVYKVMKILFKMIGIWSFHHGLHYKLQTPFSQNKLKSFRPFLLALTVCVHRGHQCFSFGGLMFCSAGKSHALMEFEEKVLKKERGRQKKFEGDLTMQQVCHTGETILKQDLF